MRRVSIAIAALLLIAGASSAVVGVRELALDDYLDKMKGGWAGQMIGVAYGGPTEFQACGKIYCDEIRSWNPGLVAEALRQDDLYVELSFLEAIEEYGLDISHEEAGKAFADTKFPLAHANKAGRENVRAGIMPPASGSREHNAHADDIDFQIEADLIGLISPGLPATSNRLCDVFGRIMNSGDGLYGGMFVASMYANAFFETDRRRLVRQSLKSIPASSVYARTIRDVMLWHKLSPDDWLVTWQKIQDRWASNPSGFCSKPGKAFNIDASLNGAYVVLGLLYGQGDMAKTLEISTRCGQDSDCNPSSAAGILGTMIGYEAIPEEYTSGIPAIADQKFAEVRYTWNTLIPTCEKYARENIRRAGGRSAVIAGRETFFIP